MDTDRCEFCQQEITGAYVVFAVGDRMVCAHPWCFERAHPPRPYASFREVLSADDQVLVRDLINQYMPDDFQAIILREYNRLSEEQWRRRCEEP